MTRTNAQSNAMKPKTDRAAERIAVQKQKMKERTAESRMDEPAEPISASANEIPAEPDTSTVEASVKNKGGRMRNDVEKTRLVVYLDPGTAKAVKLYALEHDSTYSDVVNAVMTRYLTELDAEILQK